MPYSPSQANDSGGGFSRGLGSCYKLCKASVTAKCQSFHLNFHFSGRSTFASGEILALQGLNPTAKLACEPLSPACLSALTWTH